MYPKMHSVSSSNVSEVGYDESNKTAYVRFKNNSLYTYKGVNKQEFDNLKTASSVGSYFHKNFKDVYPCERIE